MFSLVTNEFLITVQIPNFKVSDTVLHVRYILEYHLFNILSFLSIHYQLITILIKETNNANFKLYEDDI